MTETIDDDLFEIPISTDCDFQVGDNVVYPHHGAGVVKSRAPRTVLGEEREYLRIRILHNDMTVHVPCDQANAVGLRRVIDEDTVRKVLGVLEGPCTDMPKNWNRRFKHNREKIKTGNIYELAEVVRNLATRENEKGLSTGEKQMFTRTKKVLASELMYALEKTEDEAEEYLDGILAPPAEGSPQAIALAAHAAAAAAAAEDEADDEDESADETDAELALQD
ncbi:CarD family transcriptional regulator [Patulibacter minatonensis]|uniref:CarD family transcriptional regulator n=1 Tax=Patulibacter minatonensis TaxID=298163 RepID=UPI0006859B4F|nr:CarD family transcriptional regulator [Patulibacter minatonensis]